MTASRSRKSIPGRVIIVTSLLPLCIWGCALCEIDYKPLGQWKIEPVQSARVVDGHPGRSEEFAAQLQLPHNSPRERSALSIKARHELTSQLGSHDYRLIGIIAGGGNAYTSLPELKQKMARRAAKEGGDVLLITKTDVSQRPFVYTAPGNAYTNVYGNTAYTTYHPGATYAGMLSFPSAMGWVLKHSPGWDEVAQKILLMDDATVAEIDAEWSAAASEKPPYGEFEERMRSLIKAKAARFELAAATHPDPAVSRPASDGVVATAARSVVFIEADEAIGSGFCIDTPKTILTANHVVDGASIIVVRTPEGQKASAVVLRFDSDTDLAALILSKSIGLQPLRLRDSEPSLGDECYALGSPRGLTGTVTKGIVSAVRAGRLAQWVQTDAAINPGNSGGPLIDRDGRVIGVCDWKLSGGGTEGLAFAVGAESIRKILNP